MVFTIVGSSKKFVYPVIVQCKMGCDHVYDIFNSPIYQNYVPKVALTGAGGDEPNHTKRMLIESLVKNFMSKTKTGLEETENTDKKGEESSDMNNKVDSLAIKRVDSPNPMVINTETTTNEDKKSLFKPNEKGV